MKMKNVLSGVACMTTMAAATGAAQVSAYSADVVPDAILYVAQRSAGGDDATGDGSEEHPYETVGKGVSAAREYALGHAGETVLVEVGEGRFDLTENLVLHAGVCLRGAGRNKTALNAGGITADEAKTRAVITLTNALSAVSSMTVSNVVKGTSNGGLFRMTNGTITNCVIAWGTVSSGTSGHGGGGISMSKGLVVDCVVHDCRASKIYNHGGGILMTGGEVSHCEFYANTCANQVEYNSYGSAVAISGGHLHHCDVHDNGGKTMKQAGAIAVLGGTVDNCLVRGNLGSESEEAPCAVYLKGGTVRFCTITANGVSGGKYVGLRSSGTFESNIVWGNAANAKGDVACAKAITCRKNVFPTPNANASDNVVGDPLFHNAAAQDYRIGTTGSAAYAAALSVPDVTDDLLGRPRPAQPTCGAYEYDESLAKFDVKIKVASSSYLKGAAVPSAEAIPEGVDSSSSTVTWWLDGVNVGTGLCKTFPDADFGWHDLKVKLESGTRSAEATQTRAFKILSDKTYVGLGNGTFPYASAATATNDLYEAYQAVWKDADRTTVVHVLPSGDAFLSEGISLEYPVAITGSGCDRSAVQGAKNGCSVMLSSAGARLSDLTLHGHRGGTAVVVSGGAVLRCCISNCINSTFNTVGGGVQLRSGLVADSTIVKCSLGNAETHGGGIAVSGGVASNLNIIACWSTARNALQNSGGGAWVSGGLLVNSRLMKNGNAAGDYLCAALHQTGGTVRGCEFFANTSLCQSGGGIYVTGGVFENCTVASNGVACAALLLDGSSAVVRNSIVWGNGAGDVEIVSGNVTYSCFREASSGIDGNISLNPLLKAASYGRFALRQSSPCRDTGLHQDWMDETVDLVGCRRIVNGAVDMGAQEYPCYGFAIFIK